MFNERLEKIHRKIETQETPSKTPLPKAEIPKPVKHVVHKRRKSLFDRIRISREAARTLHLIKKAERLSLKYPLISRKYYNQALMKYYHLPIDKEEEISSKLSRYYEKVNGKHEKELLNIKHTNRKETEEALKHLKKYRNYIVIENNSLQNNLGRSISEMKRQIEYQMKITRNRKIKLKLNEFLLELKKKEHGVHRFDDKVIDHLMSRANSLIKMTIETEPVESQHTNHAVKRMFSHLGVDHKLPSIPVPKEKPIVMQRLEKFDPVKIKPPEIERVVEKKKKFDIEPPVLHEKKISERMKQLMDEKKSVYDKLKEVEGTELDRFRQTRRMTTHEDIGYRDFISSIKPKSDLHPGEQKIRKLLEAK